MLFTKSARSLKSQLAAMSLAVVFSESLAAALTPELIPSQNVGPAPLAVFFDATRTSTDDTSVDSYRQLGYRFKFNDPASGFWSANGTSKSEQIGGPLALHVFEKPGSYEVSLEVKGHDGGSATLTKTITVQDPDVVFAANRTTCLAVFPTQHTCPSGGAELIISIWPALQNGNRYLLASGQDFTALGPLNMKCSYCQLGAYSEGENPILAQLRVNDAGSSLGTNFVVEGLSPAVINMSMGGKNGLIFRNKFKANATISASSAINLGTGVDYLFMKTADQTISWPRNIAIVENQMSLNKLRDYGFFGSATELALVGNTISSSMQHAIRIPMAYKALVAHNYLEKPGSIKSHIKLHSRGLDPWNGEFLYQTLNGATRYVVLSGNRIGGVDGDVNSYEMPAAPQNDTKAEGLEDIINEDNIFIKNPLASNSQREIVFSGRRLTSRGNRFENREGEVSVGTGAHGAALPQDWQGPYFINEISIRSLLSPELPTLSPPAAVSLSVQ